MKITLCGSIAFIKEMESVSKQLEALGYEVKFPPMRFTDGNGKAWDLKKLNRLMTQNFCKAIICVFALTLKK